MGDLDHVRKRREGKKEGEHLVRKGKVGARGGISQLEACDGSVTSAPRQNRNPEGGEEKRVVEDRGGVHSHGGGRVLAPEPDRGRATRR